MAVSTVAPVMDDSRPRVFREMEPSRLVLVQRSEIVFPIEYGMAARFFICMEFMPGTVVMITVSMPAFCRH